LGPGFYAAPLWTTCFSTDQPTFATAARPVFGIDADDMMDEQTRQGSVDCRQSEKAGRGPVALSLIERRIRRATTALSLGRLGNVANWKWIAPIDGRTFTKQGKKSRTPRQEMKCIGSIYGRRPRCKPRACSCGWPEGILKRDRFRNEVLFGLPLILVSSASPSVLRVPASRSGHRCPGPARI
jgi:hypothetical protein